MKVAELEGALLDYWVARAEGNLTLQSTGPDDAVVEHYGVGGEIDGRSPLASWAPSENWDTGGPIIEREGISVLRWEIPDDDGMLWTARNLTATVHERGFAPLVAAMRAFVASRFGDEVPDVGSIPSRKPN